MAERQHVAVDLSAESRRIFGFGISVANRLSMSSNCSTGRASLLKKG